MKGFCKKLGWLTSFLPRPPAGTRSPGPKVNCQGGWGMSYLAPTALPLLCPLPLPPHGHGPGLSLPRVLPGLVA